MCCKTNGKPYSVVIYVVREALEFRDLCYKTNRKPYICGTIKGSNKRSQLGSFWAPIDGVLLVFFWDCSGALRRKRGRQVERGKGGGTFWARAARSRAKRGSAQRMTQSYVCQASGQIRKARAKVNEWKLAFKNCQTVLRIHSSSALPVLAITGFRFLL